MLCINKRIYRSNGSHRPHRSDWPYGSYRPHGDQRDPGDVVGLFCSLSAGDVRQSPDF